MAAGEGFEVSEMPCEVVPSSTKTLYLQRFADFPYFILYHVIPSEMQYLREKIREKNGKIERSFSVPSRTYHTA